MTNYTCTSRTLKSAAFLAGLAFIGISFFTANAQTMVQRWATSAFASASNRDMVYNEATDHLLLVLAGSTGGAIKIINATNGTAATPATMVWPTAAMNLDGIGGTTVPSGTHFVAGLAMGSDGAIYGCNYGSSGTRYILKWTSESAQPTVVYSGPHLAGLTGSIGANMAVYGGGSNAVFVMSSTTTSGATATMLVYNDGTAWVGKVLTVPNGSVISGLSFIDYGVVAPNTYRLLVKCGGANGAILTFDPTSPSPITAGTTTMAGTFGGYSLNGPHNNAYDPATGLIAGVTRVSSTTPFPGTNMLVNTGMKFGTGTLTNPVELGRANFNGTAGDGGGANGVTWGRGAFFISASALGTTLFAYDVTAFLVQGPTNVTGSVGQTATLTSVFGGSQLTYVWKKGDTVLTDDSKYSGTTTASLTVTSLALEDAGNYTVSVTGIQSSTATASADLTVDSAPAQITMQTSAPGVGTVTGAPNTSYTVEYTDSLSAITWQVLQTVVTDGTGVGSFTDASLNPNERYYRATLP